MVKYKITNGGKRPITVYGHGLSSGQSFISDKPLYDTKIICEKIEEKEKVKPKLKLDLNKKTIEEDE